MAVILGAFCIFEKQQSDAKHQHSSRISVLFLSLSNSILKLQLNWGSNLWCDEKRKPRTAPSAAELTEAVDRICGLIEMMCSISHPNELYFIIGHIVINQTKKKKNIHLGTQCNLCPKGKVFHLIYLKGDCFISIDIIHQLTYFWMHNYKKNVQNTLCSISFRDFL